jgi:hypothetical protein
LLCGGVIKTLIKNIHHILINEEWEEFPYMNQNKPNLKT